MWSLQNTNPEGPVGFTAAKQYIHFSLLMKMVVIKQGIRACKVRMLHIGKKA